MKAATAVFAETAFMLLFLSVCSVYAQGVQDVTVDEKSLGCFLDGTRIRNTYIRNADPEKLKEATRIFKDSVPDTDYPVGTILQLLPGEAMVKRPSEEFPLTNGWEFFALDIMEHGVRIRAQGDRVSNINSVPCMACHQAAAKFDFVCGKGHGCAPLAFGDKKIAELQAADQRCPKK